MEYEVVWSGGEGLSAYRGNSPISPYACASIETMNWGEGLGVRDTTPNKARLLTLREKRKLAADKARLNQPNPEYDRQARGLPRRGYR
jgi:hypothetical protein